MSELEQEFQNLREQINAMQETIGALDKSFQEDHATLTGVVKGNQTVILKLDALHRIVKSFITLNRDMVSRFDVMKDLLIRAKITTDEEVETLWDEKRGMVLRTTGLIENGDIVYVDFTAKTDEGAVLGSHTMFPVRIGSGRVAFEEVLLGKDMSGDLSFTISKDFKSDRHSAFVGKIVHFSGVVRKVKYNKAVPNAKI